MAKSVEPETMKRYWAYMGKHFGYPQCCIDGFVKKFGEFTELQVDASAGRGFIPCAAHAAQITGGLITIESLIANREHPRPYPMEDYKAVHTAKQQFAVEEAKQTNDAGHSENTNGAS